MRCVLLALLAVLVALVACAQAAPGYWKNETLVEVQRAPCPGRHRPHDKDGGKHWGGKHGGKHDGKHDGHHKGDRAIRWAFAFDYGLVPAGSDYYFALEMEFEEVVAEFTVSFDASHGIADIVEKDKTVKREIVLHSSALGDVNNFAVDALRCGRLSGVVISKVRPVSIKSALYLNMFALPEKCDNPTPDDHEDADDAGEVEPVPEPEPQVHTSGFVPPPPHHYSAQLPPVLAALVAFFATIASFLLVCCCCCLCVRMCTRARRHSDADAYPAEYDAVPTSEAGAFEVAPTELAVMAAPQSAQPQPQYVVPMLVNGETVYVQVQMMYPHPQPAHSV